MFRLDGRGLPFELSPEDPWDVELDIPDQGCSVLASLFSLTLPPELGAGQIAGNLDWKGSAEDPQIRAVTSLTSVRAAGRSINAQLGWTLRGDTVEFGPTRLKTAAEGTILHLEGGAQVPLGRYILSRWGPTALRDVGLNPHISDISVAAVFDKVDMSLVHLLKPALEPITGLMRGNVQFSGRADEPVLSAELTVLGARIGGRELHPIELTADLLDDRLSADFSLRPRVGGGAAGPL